MATPSTPARLGDDAPIAPAPTEQLRPGDPFVVVGRPESLTAFLRHVIGGLGGG